MSSTSRPTLSLSRKTPLKSKKLAGAGSGKKKTGVGNGGLAAPPPAPAPAKPWVDTVTDLSQYKPTKEELEAKKVARKSNNKVLAKVSLADKRGQLDPERQRLVQQQVLLDYRQQPNQNVEAILARSEQVMGICQGILNGEMITPTYTSSGEGESGEGCGGAGEEDRLAAPPCPALPPLQQPNPPYMNSAALNEIAGELLITVRELREELLQEREARERLEREVLQQRELLSELAREVVRLQVHCTARPGDWVVAQQGPPEPPAQQLEGTRIV